MLPQTQRLLQQWPSGHQRRSAVLLLATRRAQGPSKDESSQQRRITAGNNQNSNVGAKSGQQVYPQQKDHDIHGSSHQQPGYVSEPWEVAEPRDVAEPWEQQYVSRIEGRWRQQQALTPAGQDAASDRFAAGSWSDTIDTSQDEQYEEDDLWLLPASDDGEDEAEHEVQDAQQQKQNVQQMWREDAQLLRDVQSAFQQAQQQQQAAQMLQQRGVSGSNSSSPPPMNLQVQWEEAMAAALSVLGNYDVRYDVQRQPRLSSSRGQPAGGIGPDGLGPDQVCLTAAAAAAAAAKARRVRRQQAPAEAPVPAEVLEQEDSILAAAVQAPHHQQQPLLPDDDPRWQAVVRQHEAYLGYMRQLAGMVVSKKQQGHQLVYQVGICEHWLQLQHILTVMGGPGVPPAVTAAMWSRLAGIISRKVFVRMSHAERVHYDLFIEQLAEQSSISMDSCSSSPSVGGSSKSRASASSRRSSSTFSSSSSNTCSPSHCAVTAYGMAVLGVSSPRLAAAVEQASACLLRQAAAADQPLVQPDFQESGGAATTPAAVDAAAASVAAVDVHGWSPADIASLLWGLGTLGHRPSRQWLEDATTVSHHMLASLQPSQLWGVLWGLSRMPHLPPEPWMASWLAAARQQMDGFNAEGLAHAVWALAALGHVPDKLWLRALSGMVAYKIRSFMAAQLAMLLPALSSLGYKPRAELCRTIIAQARRQLHTFKPSQLAAVLCAIAAYPPGVGAPASTSGWHPGRLFLFDFISHSSPAAVMQAWSGHQAAQVLWAFSRFRYVPDRSYLRALLSHLEVQLPACGPDALALALWGLAALRQQLPHKQWGQAWCTAALACADGFGPQALAHGLAAMAALRLEPPAELMQALTRTASGLLSSASSMELGLIVAALADLHWRPSNAWMAAFVSQVSQQLPGFENEDYGLLLYGLASLGQPLSPQLLSRFAYESGRKLYGFSGEGLGLLVWGMAQYDYELPDAEDWWAALFVECAGKWQSTTLRGCALMLVGLAQLGPRHLPPGEWESGYITRYKAVSQKPASWEGLLLGVRIAAGLEPGETLQLTPWLNNMLLKLGMAWGLQPPEQGGTDLAAMLGEIDAQWADAAVASAALCSAGDGDVEVLDAGVALGSWHVLGRDPAVGQLQLGRGSVEPTSAAAVLL